MSLSENTKINAALKILSEQLPYLWPFMSRARFIARPSVPTISMDRYGRVYYNEGYLMDKPAEELAGDLLQLFEREMRSQSGRRGSRDRFLWFLSCLLESGDDIEEMGLPRAAEAIGPDFYDFPRGLTAEEYYTLLSQMDSIELPFSARGPDGRPLSQDGRIRYPNPEKESEPPPDMPIYPDSEMMGEDMPWEDMQPVEPAELRMDPLLMGGILDEVRRAAEEWEEITAGKVPDWLLRTARVQRVSHNWRRRLERLIGDSMHWGSNSVTFTWSKPSLIADCVPDGLILPSYEVSSPAVAVVVDTSDSMQADELGRALGQIEGLLRAMGISEGLVVLPTDSTVKEAQKVFSVRQVQLVGGGGTDMRAGLTAAKNLRPRPDAVIVLTDGYTPWPDKAPERLQVIVVNVSERWPANKRDQQQYPAPKWAKLVVMFPPGGNRRVA